MLGKPTTVFVGEVVLRIERQESVMALGPVTSTLVGAGVKLGANVVNSWLNAKDRQMELVAAERVKLIDEQTKIIASNAKDPFVQMSRRVLFMALTFTFCWLVIYFATRPDIDWMVSTGEGGKLSLFSFIFGAKSGTVHAGALVVTSFVDLMFMVIGFYAIRSNRK